MPLSPDQLQKISSVFTARGQIRSIPVGCPDLQRPALPSQIFELVRMDGQHYLLRPLTTEGMSLIPALDGMFAFVILASAPGHIFCGVTMGYDDSSADSRLMIDGHTSLSKREDILFAGELIFNNGTLENWTNGSGHYRPEASLRYNNIIPYVKRLLPEDLFLDVFDILPKNQSHLHSRLVARGYLDTGSF